MSKRDAKQENDEDGFRPLFRETLPPPRLMDPLAVIMTKEEIFGRFLALPVGILAPPRLIKALQSLGIDVTRSQEALSSSARDLKSRRDAALHMIALAQRIGPSDADCKAWVIDQVARILAGDSYVELVAETCAGGDGAATYRWDVGIAP